MGSPTDLPSWSASHTSTIDGGMSCVCAGGRISPVVWRLNILTHHHCDRDDAHGDDRGRDSAGDGAKHGATRAPRRTPAAHRPEQLAEASTGPWQAAPFENRAHRVKNGMASSSSLEMMP